MNALSQIKEEVITDTRDRINSGLPIGDEILPPNPIRVEVVGKSAGNLQVRVIYNDRAPYYFTVETKRANMKRTIYADLDGIISELQSQREAALSNKDLPDMPRYRRMWWGGRAEGLESAIRLLQDWAGETEPVETDKVTLTDDERELLSSYRYGPRIWDATALLPTVSALADKGLIEPRPGPGGAYRLTETGRAFLVDD